MKKLFGFSLLICFSFLLLSFAKRKKKTTNTTIQGNYEIVSYSKGNETISVSNKMTNISLDTKLNTLSCNVGCNSIGGTFKTKGTMIEPMRLISTEMYCEEVADMESQVVENLGAVNNYAILKERVNLKRDNEVLLTLKRK